jgi:hypothetical protein
VYRKAISQRQAAIPDSNQNVVIRNPRQFMAQTNICARSNPDACRSTAFFRHPPFCLPGRCCTPAFHDATWHTSGLLWSSNYSVGVRDGCSLFLSPSTATSRISLNFHNSSDAHPSSPGPSSVIEYNVFLKKSACSLVSHIFMSIQYHTIDTLSLAVFLQIFGV